MNRHPLHWFLLWCMLTWTAAAAAQETAFRPPRLTVADGQQAPVLRSVTLHSEISGNVAETAVEMLFHNPNPRVLEGQLQFPLLAGQRVVGMALDIGGTLREAVPVDKSTGQAVFEDVTRQRIDPALLEATSGNNFKLRVYPLPANGTRRVVIRYSESLPPSATGYRLRLPLTYAERLDQIALTVRVTGRNVPTAHEKRLGEVRFRKDGDAYVAHLAQQNYRGGGVVEVTVPRLSGPQVYTQAWDGKHYFHVDLPVHERTVPRLLPKRLAVIWDASGSGAGRQHARELALLLAYVKAMGQGEITLYALRDTVETLGSFQAGQVAELRRAVEGLVYDGATHLAGWPDTGNAEEAIYVGDGLDNYSAKAMTLPKIPVHVLSSSAKSDAERLQALADGTGGRLIDLTVDTPEAGLAKLTHTGTVLLETQAQGAGRIVVASKHPQAGRLQLAGVFEDPAGMTLQVSLREPDGKIRSVAVTAKPGQNSGRFAARSWASLNIAGLAGDYRFHRAEIRRLGRAFGLVTRETSLIVLDRVEDYARHDITPPPELLAEFQRLRSLGDTSRQQARSQHIERVVSQFKQKVDWWERDFPKDDPPKLQIAREKSRADSEGMRLRSEAAPVASAPPPPEAPAPARALRAPADDRPAPKMARPVAAAAKDGIDEPRTQTTIALKQWTADAPYINRLRDAQPDEAYRIYLDERPGYLNSTAFFLDAADQLLQKGQRDAGLRVLSNLAEMDLENRHILRILGYRLLQAKAPKLAIPVFRRVLELSPEEPQSYRDLGLALAADGQRQEAIDKLWEVVAKPWHGRFPEVELIALAELNAIVATAPGKLDVSRIDPRLLRNLPLELRAVLTWDADNTDIDLWVTDPNGERAYYGNRLTRQGGRMSLDFTGGYGPEEFSLKRAKPGKYLIQANFYGHRQQLVSSATTLQVKLQTGFGGPAQKEEVITIRLKDRAEVVTVGEFVVK